MNDMKKLSAVLLACAMILSLAACSAGTGTSTQTPKELKTLTIANSADIDDFNPFTSQMTDYITYFVFNCYEPLFHFDENMKYAMDLATEVNQVDDTTIVIKTREGVKFHDGQSFGPEDVIFTIKKTLDASVGAWRAPQYENVESIEATGANEVTIKLSVATPAFLDNLAYTPIVCKDVDMGTLLQKSTVPEHTNSKAGHPTTISLSRSLPIIGMPQKSTLTSL